MKNLHRPIYHLMPQTNWMNDPNGPVYYNGEYHLFYQYNPFGNKWGSIHWGHASSSDMVHWRHWPIALSPSPELGEEHCFSGCTVVNQGVPTVIYTSIGDGDRNALTGAQQWLAQSHDNMLTFVKSSANPIMTSELHGNMKITDWRDPFVFQDREAWFMVLGGMHNTHGCALLYRSDDLFTWQFMRILLEAPGETWECPNFFPLGDRYVLVYSPVGPVSYYVGTWQEDFSFVPSQSGLVDHSGMQGYYATNVFVDQEGRTIMWAWIPENARGDFNPECPYAGIQALPRVITLGYDDRLRMHPLPELTSLRNHHWQQQAVVLSSKEICSDIHGKALEILVKARCRAKSAVLYLRVLRSHDQNEETIIKYDFSQHEITIDRSNSSLSELPHAFNLSAKLIEYTDTLTLHVFIDHCVIEVFANYQESITTCVYPLSSDSVHVSMSASEGAMIDLESFDVWDMQQI